MAKRIQMSRQRPWRAENPDAVIVDRSTKWGNPFSAGVLGREHAVAAFEQLVSPDGADARAHLDYPEPEDIAAELGGRDLACWCPADEPCHADVLLRIANADRS